MRRNKPAATEWSPCNDYLTSFGKMIQAGYIAQPEFYSLVDLLFPKVFFYLVDRFFCSGSSPSFQFVDFTEIPG